MKTLLFIITSIIVLSCEKYTQPKFVDITGKYVVDRITVFNYENSADPNNKTYNPGDFFIDSDESFPMDSIYVGFTTWDFNYQSVSFSHYTLPTGQVKWYDSYYYYFTSQNNADELGYLNIMLDNGNKRVFKLIDDGLENTTLRTTGQWANGPAGSAKTVTIYLTRIGP